MAAGGQLAPYFSFGLIADPQYADTDDGSWEGRTLRYREAAGKLTVAVAEMSQHPERLEFVLVLGDFINGRPGDEEGSRQDLELMASIMDSMDPIPVYHTVGNHDLAVPREVFTSRLKIPSSSYYRAPLAPGWVLLVLDTTHLCPLSGYPPDSEAAVETRAYAEEHPLGEEHPHMHEWNGGLAAEQRSWLASQLTAAEAAGEKVIVASHHPIGGGSARPMYMAWNHAEVEEMLTRSHSVVMALAGHDHLGGYKCNRQVHFVTLEAMLEAPSSSNAFAIVNVFPDHIEVRGVGAATSRKLLLPDRLVACS
eukprot:CAMPEP_0202892322 /NCGR_PEP_ID=MMETSP1392-20130828/2048_1 /ASSEMBLY_ACC=CAM_ASM_000868 /TAXON_ID=225041 /ORGANISM="Chlamydomonas chlamydogama, Strain SAG 11-48b" /LENGTH=308 /DNA_ID=CAMNT_0049576219 /DNA_START=49 /DNA_END=975 /DNA_ORIENTATION=-